MLAGVTLLQPLVLYASLAVNLDRTSSAASVRAVAELLLFSVFALDQCTFIGTIVEPGPFLDRKEYKYNNIQRKLISIKGRPMIVGNSLNQLILSLKVYSVKPF